MIEGLVISGAALATALSVLGMVALTVLIVLFAIQSTKRRREQLIHTLQAVAAERNGVVHTASTWSNPTASLDVGGSRAEVSYYSTGGKHPVLYTDLLVSLGTKGPPFKLSQEHSLSGVGKALGMQDVQAGDPVFDDTFMVKGDDKDLPGLLDPGLRAALVGFKRWKGKNVSATVKQAGLNQSLHLRKLSWFNTAEDMRGYLGECERVVTQYKRAWAAPFTRVADELGLRVEPRHGLPRVEGRVGDRRISVAVEGNEHAWVVTIQVQCAGPPGMTLTHKEHGTDRVDLANPVLDMLVAAQGPEDTLRELFQDQELSEALLAVVHGNPGSQLSSNGVMLTIGHWPDADTLSDKVKSALRLAQAMDRVMESRQARPLRQST